MKTIILDGETLTYKQLTEFIENPSIQVQISSKAKDRVHLYRSTVEKWLVEEKKVIYGITTGLGKLKDFVVEEQDQSNFQQKILRSHAVGLGPYFPETIVRLAMLIRVNVFCRGNSGVRVEFIERILELLNNGVCPLVPQIGSLGVGDLQPMAHIGLCLIGADEGRVRYQGEEGSAAQLLSKAHIIPEFHLAAKEALALIDGSTMVLAASVYALYKAENLCTLADVAVALNLEATRGELAAFDVRTHELNNIDKQKETATFIRNQLEGSEWITPIGRQRLGEMKPRVQDAVSLRSTPQVHGAIKDVLQYVESILAREMNASKDNPLIFYDGSQFESLSGGNYHGAHLAYAMDFLGIVMTDLAVISERRSARLLDPIMSYGLPANLISKSAGLNNGFSLTHANTTAIIGEMRILATPASIGSIPAKSNQEDHNSMAMGAVRKALSLIDYMEQVIAIELLCASQAIDVISVQMNGLHLGKGTARTYQIIRESIEPMWEDRYILADIQAMIELVKAGRLTDGLT